MLQLMEERASRVFNATKIIRLHKQLPHIHNAFTYDCICARCRYINPCRYNFCTNCGYPIKQEGTHTLYKLRTKQRKEILKKSEQAIQAARVTLYILSTIFFLGIAFLFGELESRYFLSIAFVTLSGLYLLLARWSLTDPFTALLTGFIIVLTFSTILIFGEFVNTFTTVQGLYSIVISMLVIYFLLKGIQGAYKADIIKDELAIN